MVEILWNSNAPHPAVQDHDVVELRLVDLGGDTSPRFLLREIHASWSAARQQIDWKGYQDETCATPQEATRQFERRKASLVDAGFPYSTVLA